MEVAESDQAGKFEWLQILADDVSKGGLEFSSDLILILDESNEQNRSLRRALGK